MMLAEVMSAMGDEFAYYQDRIGRERYFESASQRRSVRRQARMIDYYLHDGKGGSTWLDFTVNAAAPVHVVSSGTQVWVRHTSVFHGESASLRLVCIRTVFEVGHGFCSGLRVLHP